MAARGNILYLIHTSDGQWVTKFDDETHEYEVSPRIEDAKLFRAYEYTNELKNFVYINGHKAEFIEQRPLRISKPRPRKKRRV